MGSLVVEKRHLVFVPYPAQGHINPMLTLAKLLHSRGFFITFVNTEYNHKRLVKSRGPESVAGLDDFRFETVPDGLPATDFDRTQDIPALCNSIRHNFHPHFLNLLLKLSTSTSSVSPPVSCIISDAVMSVTLAAAEQLGIPEYVFYTASACGVVGYLLFPELIEKGLVPLKDESFLTNGYLDTEIDWVPGMEGIRLRDLPTFIRTTDIDDVMLNFDVMNARNAPRAKAVILNTFDELEKDALEVMRTKFGLRLFTLGPLSLLRRRFKSDGDGAFESIGSNLWAEDRSCVEWLEGKEPGSVVYVNFGSVTVMSSSELREMAWGIAATKLNFLWIIRPDLVKGDAGDDSVLASEDFLREVEGRGRFARWCAQEEVLAHPSVGCFLTHSGWNSTLESVSCGVPMICWPFFAEQQMNCRFGCVKWGVAMEMGKCVRRKEVESLVREMMGTSGGGEKGEKMRKKALEWEVSAERAVMENGSSFKNLEKLIVELITG
ncbi:hypothetical protein H6P81_011415 [Aristolochia fimbriata]|uniref:Glycosyltransferase n=1 Tax=Aristolochia fimbriata TaxID=158543 RepID=A0AAV7ETN5_ARIFI|nr:hypothetical protein H6P81_011415 [Aristolochia fimbriata]